MLGPHAKAGTAGPGAHLQSPRDARARRKGFTWKSSTRQENSSPDEGPEQLSNSGAPTGGEEGGQATSHTGASCWRWHSLSCQAPDALTHVILVTPVTGMEMEDLKVKQPANEPLLDAPAVRGRFPRLLSEPAVLTSTLS